jgi:F-type H+-transporting ATPase subunit epsilon
MSQALMHLKVLLPFQILLDNSGVSSIVADTCEGSFQLLPHRLDCVAALVPSILAYETGEEGKIYLAVDEGILVKAGLAVTISVRQAIAGKNLNELRQSVQKVFLNLNDQELKVRRVTAKLESSLIRRMAEFQHE